MGKQGLIQKLALQQKLSPQQILLMKMLQIPTIALEQRIKQEIEENPALDELPDYDENEPAQSDDDDFKNELDDSESDEFDLKDYMGEDDIPGYKLSANNYSPDDNDRKEIPFSGGKSFHDFLISQLGLRYLSEKQAIIAETIIGNIDESGYLRRDIPAMVDDLSFSQNIFATPAEINEVLSVIQDLDPAGVGARDLKECLLLQLKRNQTDYPEESFDLSILILERYFDEFSKKHYDKIIKKAKITDTELKEAIDQILKLNPKPGNSISETAKTNHYIIPDFIITAHNGELELTLNSKNAPELRLNKTYVDMIEVYALDKSKKTKQQRETIQFIKSKIESAKWFIDAIKQRQNTLMVTMNAIMEYQKDYFLTGDETRLRPMILKDIADIVNLDISTISRVANSKYVQTPFGTFLLKSFFSESMQTDTGEEVSTREIKKILQDCINEENKSKPLTDDQLTVILKDKGYNIARRTVAKYREQLSIPVARLRKEL
ncbi:MAG TPA: RNA polymerase factor sigma-54 [Bacteroidales bacterium]|nr:RNA polymerase factor sigma-54 [Bacteroidales bacterium]HPR56755.1 RNA polymerase factor sigma-54 [Bacteroidales bacterium]